MRSLGTPRVSKSTTLANAQRTYSPHGICFSLESGMSMPQEVDTALHAALRTLPIAVPAS